VVSERAPGRRTASFAGRSHARSRSRSPPRAAGRDPGRAARAADPISVPPAPRSSQLRMAATYPLHVFQALAHHGASSSRAALPPAAGGHAVSRSQYLSRSVAVCGIKVAAPPNEHTCLWVKTGKHHAAVLRRRGLEDARCAWLVVQSLLAATNKRHRSSIQTRRSQSFEAGV